MVASIYPSIKLHCPCSEPMFDQDEEGGRSNEASISSEQQCSSSYSPRSISNRKTRSEHQIALTLPPSLYNKYALHSLNNLYFCDVCMALRCQRCVVDEVIQTYCPSCLYVYNSDAIGISRRLGSTGEHSTYCTRNCLQCPYCEINLLMLSLPSKSNDSKEGDILLQCPYCKWHSGRIDTLSFTKQSSLYAQLHKFKSSTTNQSIKTRFSALDGFYQGIYDTLVEEETVKELSSPIVNPFASLNSPTLSGGINRRRSIETTRFLKSYYSHHAKTGGSSPGVSPSNIHLLGKDSGIPARKSRELEEREWENLPVEFDEEEDAKQ
ncbi:dynactin p62 family-domain-containing protein, partial [Dipodascopsis uninucleata]